MDAREVFAELCRDFCATVLDLAEQAIPLQDRVITVDASLAQVVAAGFALPVEAGTPPIDPAHPLDLDAWPGFGSFEAYWTVGELAEPANPIPCRLSETLYFVFGQLWAGLEAWEAGDAERAVGVWGAGFETTWGPAAVELLHALHPVVAGYRGDARRSMGARTRRAAPRAAILPTRQDREEPRPTEPAAGPPPGTPMLGVRFEPCPGGVAVLAVHPEGPAADRLLRGDIVLSVDGVSLADLPPDAAGLHLVGPVGVWRRYEVFRGGSTAMVEIATVASIGTAEM
jgi:hypothetical protein